MIIVNVKKEGGIDKALKKLKFKVRKHQLMKEIRDRQAYIKPSVRSRSIKLKAIYNSKRVIK